MFSDFVNETNPIGIQRKHDLLNQQNSNNSSFAGTAHQHHLSPQPSANFGRGIATQNLSQQQQLAISPYSGGDVFSTLDINGQPQPKQSSAPHQTFNCTNPTMAFVPKCK